MTGPRDDDVPAVPTPREAMAEALVQAAFHWHLDQETPQWQEFFLRLADVAITMNAQEEK